MGDDLALISTFIHEQCHWLVADRDERRAAAIEGIAEIFPNAPGREGGGARSPYSSYLHLIVGDLEFQGMTALFGEGPARKVLAAITPYPWVNERVLNDPRVRETNERFGRGRVWARTELRYRTRIEKGT